MNQAASVIPKIIKKKKVGERFPLLTEDINATRDIILQLVEFYSIVRRFYDDSKEKIDFFIGPDFIVPLLMYKATQLGVPTLDRATLERFVEPSKGTNNFKNTVFYHLAELRDTRTSEFENLNKYATNWLQTATVAVKMHADLVEYTDEDVPLAKFCKMSIDEDTES